MASRLCFTIGFLIVASVGLLHGASAANYTVGGDLGWIVPPNKTYYEEWASQRTFQKGDSFIFTSKNGTHTVTEVHSKEEYDNCAKMGGTPNSPGIEFIFNLNRSTSYFLCTEGTDCEQGQKVTIKIGDDIPPSFAAPSLTAAAALSVLFFTTLAIFFLN